MKLLKLQELAWTGFHNLELKWKVITWNSKREFTDPSLFSEKLVTNGDKTKSRKLIIEVGRKLILSFFMTCKLSNQFQAHLAKDLKPFGSQKQHKALHFGKRITKWFSEEWNRAMILQFINCNQKEFLAPSFLKKFLKRKIFIFHGGNTHKRNSFN